MPSPSIQDRFGAFLGIASAIVVADQVTKVLVRASIREPIVIVPGFFDLVHVANPGAAFSFLATAPASVREPLFLAVGVVAVALLAVLTAQLEPEERGLRWAYGGVLGGAVGNLIDRVRFGEVTDFLDVHYAGWHWPAFNVADSSITLSVIAILIHSLRADRTPRDTEES